MLFSVFDFCFVFLRLVLFGETVLGLVQGALRGSFYMSLLVWVLVAAPPADSLVGAFTCNRLLGVCALLKLFWHSSLRCALRRVSELAAGS